MSCRPHDPEDAFDPTGITRPDEALLKYYILLSLLWGPLSPFAFLRVYLKYRTLHYRFDESGVSMGWGLLFRHEIHLTYRRIQDIHLTRNLIQRWMGLATVGVETASGGSEPQMSIVGIVEAAALRDYLYTKMRGVRERSPAQTESVTAARAHDEQALSMLGEIRDALQELAAQRGAGP